MAGTASKTKAYHRFKERCDYYETDLQLCELLVRDFVAIPNSDESVAVVLGSDKSKHARLGQVNSKRTREIRGGHLKRTLNASFVKDLYEDFVDFIAETMTKAAQKGVDPGRFAGEVKLDLQAKEVLGAASWDGVVTMISQKVFRALENERKTTALISKAALRLGLTIDQVLIDAAMPYLDARHMLVHQDGRADVDYRKKYPRVPIRGGKIILDSAFITSARQSVDSLAKAFDEQIIKAGLVRQEHLCP